MIVTKKALSRRTVLRGAGVALALPLLDAMVPALSAISKTAAKPTLRLGFVYVPNGVHLKTWIPQTVGRNIDLPATLKPLEGVRDHLVVVSGLANVSADIGEKGGGPHTRAHAVWLCGVPPKLTEGADLRAGTTIDQYAAEVLGRDTALRSLEMALEPNFMVGNCDNGYSCTYINTFSWRTPTSPNPMETNPRLVFERLFGYAGDGDARAGELRKDRSILDWVARDVARVNRTLGPGDRRVFDEYLDAVREVEQRIQRAERQAIDSELPTVEQPRGIPDDFDEHARLMFELNFLAYRADITRVVSFQLAREQSGRSYPAIGVPEGHHDISHAGSDPGMQVKNTKINTYHMSLFAGLVERMRTTQDGDGTLLDHAMLLYGGGMGDGSVHSPHALPVALVGGGCGQLEGGRHLQAVHDTPMMNLGLSLLDKAGVTLERIGDSTGRLSEL